MWVRRAAIRPVPPYARVPSEILREIEDELAEDTSTARARLDEAFERFEKTQAALAGRVSKALNHPLDETALALGYFLTLSIWLSFERYFDSRLGEVGSDHVAATEQSLALDEELRRVDPAEAVDSDDVVGMEQPHLVSFVHEHLDHALEAHASEVDLDDVDAIYHLVLVEILALSYAVVPPEYYDLPKTEFCA